MATSGVQTVGSSTQRGLVAVDGRTYPLKSAAISARAGAGVAAATLVQEFENPYAEPLEAIYTLPLPADGAVVGYAIQVGERRIVGEIEVRETATRRYAEALAAGRTAGLLEQERADTFTQRVGNIPPGVAVRVEIQVVQPLAFVRADGVAPEWEWRFPTVVGPRYLGNAGRVPDAGQLEPPRAANGGTPARVTLALEIADGAAAEIAPHSPSHALQVAAADAPITAASSSDLPRTHPAHGRTSAPRDADARRRRAARPRRGRPLEGCRRRAGRAIRRGPRPARRPWPLRRPDRHAAGRASRPGAALADDPARRQRFDERPSHRARQGRDDRAARRPRPRRPVRDHRLRLAADAVDRQGWSTPRPTRSRRRGNGFASSGPAAARRCSARSNRRSPRGAPANSARSCS